MYPSLGEIRSEFGLSKPYNVQTRELSVGTTAVETYQDINRQLYVSATDSVYLDLKTGDLFPINYKGYEADMAFNTRALGYTYIRSETDHLNIDKSFFKHWEIEKHHEKILTEEKGDLVDTLGIKLTISNKS